MTSTIPRIGTRARLKRCAAGAVSVAIAASIFVTGVMPAAAETPPPTEQAEQASEDSVSLDLSVGVHGRIDEGAPFTADATVTNDTGERLTAGRVVWEINRTALSDSTAMAAWMDEGRVEGPFDSLVAENTVDIDAGNASSQSVFVSAAELGALPAGVYPVRAALSGATTGTGEDATNWTARSRTTLVVSSNTDGVGVIVPITATPESAALLTSAELQELTSPEGSLTAQLEGVAGSSAILAVDPSIIAAIRALGSSAPEPAVDWLQRLEALSNDRFLLQFGDADATTQAQAELASLLQPTGIDALLDPKNFILEPSKGESATPSPSPSPTPSASKSSAPTSPVLPTLEELTELRGADRAVLWPRADVSPETLATLGSYVQDALTVLPSSAVTAGSTAHASVNEQPVLVTDQATSSAASAAATETDDVERDALLAQTSSELHFARAAHNGGPVLVGLDRDEDRSADALRETISALGGNSTLDVDAVLSTPAAPRSLVESSESTRGDVLNAVLADEQRIGAFASILADPQLLLAPERIRILRLIRVGAPLDTFLVTLGEHRAQTEQTLNSVGIQPPSAVQLISAAAPIPVWVRNDLPWPVTVRLTAQPSDPRLAVQRTSDVEAQPGSNTRVLVPVEARVGSGSLSINYSLASTAGVAIGENQSATVTVRAEWEGIGLTILGVLIVLLLGLGILRTVLRKRRDAQQDDSVGAEAAGDAQPDAESASPSRTKDTE